MDQLIPNYRIVITREDSKWYAFAAHAIDPTAFCFYKSSSYKSSKWNRYLTAYDAYLALIADYWWLDFPYVTDIKIRRSLTDSNLPPLETS